MAHTVSVWFVTAAVPAVPVDLAQAALPAVCNILDALVALLVDPGPAAAGVAASGRLPVSGAPRMILGEA